MWSLTWISASPTLDGYLRGRALANHVEGACRCFVTCRDGRVVGFYSLASAAVERAGTPGRVRRNMPDPVPVILLSRLAIDRREQGKGLGAALLRDAITRAVAATEIIGVRTLLVHVLHEQARTLYARIDFEPSATDPMHLLLLIKDARVLLDPPRRRWPDPGYAATDQCELSPRTVTERIDAIVTLATAGPDHSPGRPTYSVMAPRFVVEHVARQVVDRAAAVCFGVGDGHDAVPEALAGSRPSARAARSWWRRRACRSAR